MKKTVSLTLILIALLSFYSCRKGDDTPRPVVYAEENPLLAYLSALGFNQKQSSYINTNTSEQGFKFTPKVKGKIVAVTIKIPDNASNLRITIWDANSRSMLRTVIVPAVNADIEVRQDIAELPITPSANYAITFNSNDSYGHSNTDNSAITYPVSAGNISIDGYIWAFGSAQIFPTLNSYNYCGGDVSFVFQQTE